MSRLGLLASGVLLLVASQARAAVDGREAFARSVEADIAITEAETADPKNARKLYSYARELLPEDADVWFASARFEQGQKNDELALSYLNKAVALNPVHPLAPFERALLQFQLKKPEAKANFEAYRVANPLDVRAAHYLGLLALEADDLANAKAQFDVARKGDDRTAAYAAAYHAILAAQLGDKDASTYAADALKVAPTADLKAKLEALAAGSSGGSVAEERYMSWVSAALNVTTEFDSNASLAAANFAGLNSQVLADAEAQGIPADDPSVVAQLQRPRMAARLSQYARLTFRPVASQPFTLELEGEFLNANHLNDRASLARFDYGGPSARAGFVSRFGTKTQVEFGLDGNYRGTWTNTFRTPLLQSGGGSPFIGLIFWPRHTLYVIGNIEYRSFYDPNAGTDTPSLPANNRDGLVYSAGLAYSLPFSIFDAVLNAAYDNEQTRGINFRLNGVRAAAGLRMNYKNMLQAWAIASLNFRFYRLAEPARDERRYEVNVGVRYNIGRYFGLQVYYNYTHNDAATTDGTAFDLFVYRRHVVGFTLIGQY